MLDQEDDLDAHFLGVDHLLLETAAVALCGLPGVREVVRHFRQVLLPVDDQARVVQAHIVALIELARVVLNAAPVEAVEDPLYDVPLLAAVHLDDH